MSTGSASRVLDIQYRPVHVYTALVLKLQLVSGFQSFKPKFNQNTSIFCLILSKIRAILGHFLQTKESNFLAAFGVWRGWGQH